jgi:DNA primase
MSVTDEIKARLDIVDIVSETVSLKKSGRNYVGFCPFHSNTKTPSFVVFPETQTWRCFGACADGGDIFSFVVKREGYDFKEALETLAHRAGVPLKQAEPHAAEHAQQRQRLFELNAAAAAYFHQLLTTSPAAAGVRDYLTRRELTAETIATFQLGYALDAWEALKHELTKRGYSAEDLLAAGLIVARDDGAPGYDRFRNRLIIPIRDSRGRVIGFGARALADDQVPKYLNSPQTTLFDKSATLYGLDLARKQIRQADEAIIVEGYMDVIQAHQRGARNVVAQMGTALTEQQLKRVASLANRIVLALDSDTAGNAATIRGLSLARQALPKKPRATLTSRALAYEGHVSQEIYIASLPAGQDPDDILKTGLETWQELMAQAMPGLDYYEELIFKQADVSTPQGKSFVVNELIPIYRELGDNIEKTARVQRLARNVGLDERLLLAELKGSYPQSRRTQRRRQPSPPPEPLPEALEKIDTPAALEKLGWGEAYCLALIIAHPAALAVANETLEKHGQPGLNINDFKGGENKEIFKQLQLWTASETLKIDTLIEMVDEVLERRIATLINQWLRRPPTPLENIDRDLCMAILRMRLQSLTEQIEELKFLQHEAIENQDFQAVRQYTETTEALTQKRKQLEHTSDTLTLMGQRRIETNQFG